MRNFICFLAFLSWGVASAHEATPENHASSHPFYIGADAGFGATTWSGLVPSPQNLNMAMKTSTPTVADEGGVVWGFLAGYEFSPYFALEANYMRYPRATIFFDEESMFAFDNDGLLELNTNTETISLMAKIMLAFPRTQLRAYSSFGFSEVHRQDNLNDIRSGSPSFGMGFNYNVSTHVMAELGANYVAGYGESELNPAKDYVPFLYSVVFKLAYRV